MVWTVKLGGHLQSQSAVRVVMRLEKLGRAYYSIKYYHYTYARNLRQPGHALKVVSHNACPIPESTDCLKGWKLEKKCSSFMNLYLSSIHNSVQAKTVPSQKHFGVFRKEYASCKMPLRVTNNYVPGQAEFLKLDCKSQGFVGRLFHSCNAYKALL
ncbi:hypothetical protein ElyMa_003495000 [Elysia marginata]|uniref:Uncharacterized protein n=1 Tax=Elysia marginata TaxID=1093978 RepID=A0AAV4EFM8_9GAST|nr:hypothetical protein ElyMa_003495000 [Elysia marginata]